MIRNLIIFALCLYVPLSGKLVMYAFHKKAQVLKQEPKRADIIDADGMLLATTIPTSSVYIVPYEVLQPDLITRDLAQILNMPEQYIRKRLQTKSRSFAWILRHIAPWQAKAITQLGYSGLYIAKDMRRFYPHGSLFVHIVGKVDNDNHGISGIESAYDSYLKTSSKPLKLSLKSGLQFVVKDVLDEAKKEFNAKSVYGMIIEVKTGRILASYSRSYDEEMNPHEHQDLGQETTNFNTQSVDERGSVYKLVHAAMFLENNLIDLKTEVFAPATLRVGWHVIHEVDKRRHDCVYTFEKAFAKSSNVVHGMLTLKAGPEKQLEFMQRVGIFDHMKIDNLNVAYGLFPKKWRPVNCATASYGHGFATTNAQYVRAALRIITGFDKELHILQDYPVREEKRIISESTVNKARYLLRTVFISSWYGKRDEIEGYDIGAKTGTANRIVNGAYVEKKNLCNYLFIFPAHDPQIIAIISVDEPHATAKTYGFVLSSFIVAPLAPKIISKIGPMLGIMRKDAAEG